MTTPDEQVETLFPVDGPHHPDQTVAAARSIAALVRYLNHATMHAHAVDYPSQVASVIAGLRSALFGMDQLTRQLGGHIERFADLPDLYDDAGGNPVDTCAEATIELDRARPMLAYTADVLSRAHEATNRLGIRNPDERNPR